MNSTDTRTYRWWCVRCGREVSKVEWRNNEGACPVCGSRKKHNLDAGPTLWYKILKKLGLKP